MNWCTFILLCSSIAAVNPTKSVPVLTPPPTNDSGPVVVYVGFYIASLADFRETTMSFSLDMFLRLSWMDERLSHRGASHRQSHFRDAQWTPDLYFSNAVSAEFQHVTRPNFAIFIQPDGTVSYTTRISLRLSCQLELDEYPHDEQYCRVQLESYANPESMLELKWFPNANFRLQHNADLRLPKYSIDRLEAAECDGEYDVLMTQYGAVKNNFSCLVGLIYLKRAVVYHLVQTYVPTTMMVVISWVSFWIDSSAVPARITLSFTTLLTLTTQGASIRYGLPPVSYTKAVDYWMFTCTLFVFFGLIEYSFVNSLAQKALRFGTIAAAQTAPPMKLQQTSCLVRWWLRLTGGPGDYSDKVEVAIAGMSTSVIAGATNLDPLGTDISSNGNNDANFGFGLHARDKVSESPNSSSSTLRHYRRVQRDYQTASERIDYLSRIVFPLSFILFVGAYYFIFVPDESGWDRQRSSLR